MPLLGQGCRESIIKLEKSHKIYKGYEGGAYMSSSKELKATIKAKGKEITVLSGGGDDDYISLTDIAKYKNPEFPADVIKNWLRNRNTIEFLGLWEQLNNPSFNMVEFDQFKNESGGNTFVLSPTKWIQKTNAIGIVSKSGRYNGGTFAYKDIAFEFASWISPEFKLYIIQDYQRIKLDENSRLSLNWSVNRVLSKINYKIHTDAIKDNLIPYDASAKQKGFTYADEADMLNVIMFGQTAKQWREQNPNIKGNIRDEASVYQLLILANLENANALFISQGMSQEIRFVQLKNLAKTQMKSLIDNKSMRKLDSEN